MKTMREFVEDPNYEIANEEDVTLPENYAPPEIQPVVPEDLDADFDMPSDDELIAETGELEDNFVELAGGRHVRMDDDEEEDAGAGPSSSMPPPPQPSTANLP